MCCELALRDKLVHENVEMAKSRILLQKSLSPKTSPENWAALPHAKELQTGMNIFPEIFLKAGNYSTRRRY